MAAHLATQQGDARRDWDQGSLAILLETSEILGPTRCQSINERSVNYQDTYKKVLCVEELTIPFKGGILFVKEAATWQHSQLGDYMRLPCRRVSSHCLRSCKTQILSTRQLRNILG